MYRALHWLLVAASTLIALAAIAARATDLSHLYSDAVLEERQARYEQNIRWNFQNVILGSLTPSERAQLGPVRLDLPLRAEGDLRGHPMAFYAGGNTIVIPIFSVKFLDDLTLAWAFFFSKQMSLEPVTDYIGMLKYRDPVEIGGRHPPPLEALGIPERVWESDPVIDDVSQKALKSALVWVIAHELGHLYHSHPGYQGVSAAEAQTNEAEADQFANTIFRRIGVAPLGMPQFFMAMAHLEPNLADFESEDAWIDYLQTKATHPLTADRMRALADDLLRAPEQFVSTEPDPESAVSLIEFSANQIRIIGDLLADAEVQRSIAIKALATDLNSLQRWQTAARPSTSSGAFEGRFRGSYHRIIGGGDSETLEAEMELHRQGDRVTGRYWFGLGEGAISGRVRGDRLTYEWTWGTAYGRGELVNDPATGALHGRWGYEESADNGGSWDLAPQ